MSSHIGSPPTLNHDSASYKYSRALLEALLHPSSLQLPRTLSPTSLHQLAPFASSSAQDQPPLLSLRRDSSTSVRSTGVGAASLAPAGSQQGSAFRPSKPSSLAASASSGQSSGESDDSDEDGINSAHAKRGVDDLLEEEDHHADLSSTTATAPMTLSPGRYDAERSSSSVSSSAGSDIGKDVDPVEEVLAVLQDEGLDEEEKIDEARNQLEKHISANLRAGSADRSLVSRVSELLFGAAAHARDPAAVIWTARCTCAGPTPPIPRRRHAEWADVSPPPTLSALLSSSPSADPFGLGAAASPAKKPASLRSGSSSAMPRPWTPSRMPSGLGGPFSPSVNTAGAFSAVPTSPGPGPSSRPGTPTRGSFGGNRAATPTTAYFGVGADSDPIIRPASRASIHSQGLAAVQVEEQRRPFLPQDWHRCRPRRHRAPLRRSQVSLALAHLEARLGCGREHCQTTIQALRCCPALLPAFHLGAGCMPRRLASQLPLHKVRAAQQAVGRIHPCHNLPLPLPLLRCR